MDLFGLAEELREYLSERGVRFSKDGYPILSENMLLKEVPEGVCPFGHTSHVKDKSRYLLVSFCKDEIIYKKLFRLEQDIPMYKQFLGFGGFDLSPRINWNIHLQRFNLLLSKLADAFLAVNGVKIMPNFRTGCMDTINVLSTYPPNTWYSVGTLGCARGRIRLNEMYLRAKLILANPGMLIYYGTLKPEYESVLREFGVQYRLFSDYQRVSRGKKGE